MFFHTVVELIESIKAFRNRLAEMLHIFLNSIPPPATQAFSCVFVLCLLPHVGCPEEIPVGTQEQRGKSGEVPGRTEEAAQEEPGQQEPLQVRREGDAGERLAGDFHKKLVILRIKQLGRRCLKLDC